MTWFWLLLAGVWQPVAMEAYRWAPLLVPGDVALARLAVRLISLTGPFAILCALAVVDVGYETRTCNRIRKWAWAPAFGLMLACMYIGLEYNFPYRIAFLASQILLATAWWCAVVGERRHRHRVAHSARLAGFLFACLGVVLCVLAQFVLSWDSMTGVVEPYDPYAETPSRAYVVGLGALTVTLVLGSLAAVPLLHWAARWRGLHARLMRIGR